jgi:hypothetical protein
VTATYQAGDIVQVRKTIEVTESGSSFVRGLDVQTGDLHQFYLSGATAVEMVKKAVQKSDRRPSVGASVSGRDISRIWWKRGTVIHCTSRPWRTTGAARRWPVARRHWQLRVPVRRPEPRREVRHQVPAVTEPVGRRPLVRVAAK